MRFLVLTQYFPPEVGASQVRLAALCKELVGAGHSVEVVTAMPHHPLGRIFATHRGAFYRRENHEGIVVHRVWLYAGNRSILQRLLGYLSFSITCFFALLRAQSADYVFADSPPLFLGIPGWLAAKRWRTRLVFNVADLWPDSARDLGILRNGWLMDLASGLEAWIYRHADYVTAVTDGIRQTLLQVKHLPPHKVLFLPNGVDTDLFCPADADEPLKRSLGLANKKVVLYAGNHGYASGLEQLLRAADRLRADSSIHFLLVGDGPEKSHLLQMAVDLDLPNVSFTDSVPLNRLPALLSICDLAVVTLRKARITEGARPAKMFVMMAAGKPIVLAAHGEAANLLTAANAGVVVPQQDPVALAAAIKNLLSDPAKARRLGMNGRQFVTDHFKWSLLVRDWLEQLQGCSPSSARSPQTLPRMEEDARESA